MGYRAIVQCLEEFGDEMGVINKDSCTGRGV